LKNGAVFQARPASDIEGEGAYGTVQAEVYTSPKTLLSSKPVGLQRTYSGSQLVGKEVISEYKTHR
jgi:hypothetical protein